MIGRVGMLIAAGAVAVAGLLTWRVSRIPEPAFPIPAIAVAGAGGEMTPAEIEADRRQNLAFEREQEAAPFARWPDAARRAGDVLIVRAGGRDVASFTDTGYCDGFDQCARWRFRGVWRLGGRDYPWLTFFHGEGEEAAYVVDVTGGLVAAPGQPLASPDGRWLVVAYDDPDSGGAVTVFEAGPRGLRLAAVGDVPCRAGTWRSNQRLAMTCTDSSPMTTPRLLAVDLVRDARVWRIRPSAELDGDTRRPLVRPTRPLIDIEVPAAKDDGSPEDDAYEIDKGYRRL